MTASWRSSLAIAAAQQRLEREARKLPVDRLDDVTQEPRRRPSAAGEDIAAQVLRRALPIPGIERLVICGGPAVECLRQLLHALRHAEVADAELAQGMIDVA